jgi:hypothetical protein
MRGGGGFPRFYLVWYKDTYRTDSTTGDKKCTRRFEYPQIGNGTSKERWTIAPLVNAPKLKWQLHQRLKRRYPSMNMEACIEAPHVMHPHSANEIRCKYCNRMNFKSESTRDEHMINGSCWAAPVPRQMNSAAAQDVRRIKVAMYIDSLPHLLHNGDRVDNYLDVKYLGHIVSGDGSDDPDLNNRIALMTSTFNKYMHVWKSNELGTVLKIDIYEAFLAIMTYGCEGWLLTKTLRQKINGFNSLRLVAITGRTPHEEAKTPAYNLVLIN